MSFEDIARQAVEKAFERKMHWLYLNLALKKYCRAAVKLLSKVMVWLQKLDKEF